jgi:hypothetical protein
VEAILELLLGLLVGGCLVLVGVFAGVVLATTLLRPRPVLESQPTTSGVPVEVVVRSTDNDLDLPLPEVEGRLNERPYDDDEVSTVSTVSTASTISTSTEVGPASTSPPSAASPASGTKPTSPLEDLDLALCVASLGDREHRSTAIVQLAEGHVEAAIPSVIATLDQLTWKECHDVVESLRDYLSGESVALLQAFRLAERKAPKELMRDVLSRIGSPGVADAMLADDVLLFDMGALTLARSVRPEHLDRLLELSRHRQLQFRRHAVYGLAGLVAFSDDSDAAGRARVRLGEMAEKDRSKDVKESARGSIARSPAELAATLPVVTLEPMRIVASASEAQAPIERVEWKSEERVANMESRGGDSAAAVPAQHVTRIFTLGQADALLALMGESDEGRAMRARILEHAGPHCTLTLRVLHEEVAKDFLGGWLALLVLLAQSGHLLEMRGRLGFHCLGYLEDPRPLWAIEEARHLLGRLLRRAPWFPVWATEEHGGVFLGVLDGLKVGKGTPFAAIRRGEVAIEMVNWAYALTVRLGCPDPEVGQDFFEAVFGERYDPERFFEGVNVAEMADRLDDMGLVYVGAEDS